MIKRLLQLITNRLQRWQSTRNARSRSRQVSLHQPATTQASDRITYTLSRSEAVTALNHTLKQGTKHRTDTITAPNEQPNLIKSLADSAYLCECQGRLDEAEGFYQQAVTLSIRHFGDTHSEVAAHLSDLARFYYGQQRYAEAQPLLEQTLNIRQPYQDHQHPDNGETLYQLANIYRHLEKYAKAETLYQQALSTFRQTFGPDHAQTEAVYSDLMKMLTKVIASGQFDVLIAEIPPLDLDTLGDTYSWAKPQWMTNTESSESYSWIKLQPLSNKSTD